MDPNDLSLSGADRFDRLERMIEKVLERLDTKADAGALMALDQRVRDLELHGSSQAAAAVHDLTVIRREQQRLQNRLSWATGAIAAAVLAVNVALRFIS